MNEYESYENFTKEQVKNDNLPPFNNNFSNFQMPKQEKERQVHFKYEPAFPLYLRDE